MQSPSLQSRASADGTSGSNVREQTVASVNGQIRAEQLLGVPVTDRMWSSIFDITPELARTVLGVMTIQRPQSAHRVRQYALQMRAGKWLTTSQGITFDQAGLLMDGQHRLAAIVESNRTIPLTVTFNEPRAHFTVFDRGYVRNSAQDLVVMGLADTAREAHSISAAARILRSLDQKRDPTVKDVGRGADTDDITAVMERHPMLSETVEWCEAHRANRNIPLAPFAALLTVMREVHDSKAMTFAQQIVSRENIAGGDPAFVLLAAQDASASQRSGAARSAFMYRFVHAWNAFYQERKLSRVVASSIMGAGFPAIVGYKPKG